MAGNKNSNFINPEKYQVFLFACPGNLPFSFALHPWFVINKKGVISRWEVLFRKVEHKTRWGHLYADFFKPFQGIEIIPFCEKYFWRSRLLGKVEDETALRMKEFIEKSSEKYPYLYKYFLTGPNSNTYVQWVLNNFPEFEVKLPMSALGKNYKIKAY